MLSWAECNLLKTTGTDVILVNFVNGLVAAGAVTCTFPHQPVIFSLDTILMSNTSCFKALKKGVTKAERPPKYLFERWESGYALGILCACSQVHVSCFWTWVCDLLCFEVRRSQAESVLLAVRVRGCPIGHWVSVLPQHWSCWGHGCIELWW